MRAFDELPTPSMVLPAKRLSLPSPPPPNDNVFRAEDTSGAQMAPTPAENLDSPLVGAIAAHQFPHPTVNKLGSTTHLSVIDSDGNAASVTTSNGEGSSYVIPGTNIMVNNMLGEEDLNPHGFHQWLPNQRMSSMMAPITASMFCSNTQKLANQSQTSNNVDIFRYTTATRPSDSILPGCTILSPY